MTTDRYEAHRQRTKAARRTLVALYIVVGTMALLGAALFGMAVGRWFDGMRGIAGY